ncbi:MAG: hypothetical protein EOP50_21400 [Sphingobacteriales bacterium]|nr:MAG: hypothetical protein EOP50_21400 [Sphingobacteriales bacterium]
MRLQQYPAHHTIAWRPGSSTLIEQSVVKQWYARPTWLWVFLPLVPLFSLLRVLRRCYLQARRQKLPVPVAIIGNISVGGTGKPPSLWL